MKKVTVIAGLALVALCSLTAQAQMMEVYDIQFIGVDIGALKEGEWVEYESGMDMAGMPKTKSRQACVKIDGDMVWIEVSAADVVTLYGVSKSDRKIKEAYSGKAGEKGKALTVKKMETGGSGGTTVDMSGTAKVSKETIKVKDTDFECEKVEMDVTTKYGATEMKSKTTSWYSDKVPFRPAPADPNAKDPTEGKIKWEGKLSGKGAIVKMVSETSGMKSVYELVGWGTDAKQTLQK